MAPLGRAGRGRPAAVDPVAREDLACAGARSSALGRRDFDVSRAAEALDEVLRRALDGSARR